MVGRRSDVSGSARQRLAASVSTSAVATHFAASLRPVAGSATPTRTTSWQRLFGSCRFASNTARRQATACIGSLAVDAVRRRADGRAIAGGASSGRTTNRSQSLASSSSPRARLPNKSTASGRASAMMAAIADPRRGSRVVMTLSTEWVLRIGVSTGNRPQVGAIDRAGQSLEWHRRGRWPALGLL